MLRTIFITLLGLSILACSSKPYKEKVRTPLSKIKDTNLVKVGQAWAVSVGKGMDKERVVLRPYSDSTTVYADAVDGNVLAVQATTGKPLWRTKIKAGIAASISGDANSLYVPSANGQLIALDKRTGSKRWQSGNIGSIDAAPQSNNQIIVVRVSNGKTFGLNTLGKVAWENKHISLPFSLRGASAPTISGKQFFLGTSNGEVFGVDINSGVSLWSELVTFPYGETILDRIVDVDAKPLVVGRSIYVVSMHGRLAKLDNLTGNTLWSVDYSSSEPPVLVGGRLIASHEDGLLTAFNDTGTKLWENPILKGYDLLGPITVGRAVVVGVNGSKHLFWFDARTGKLLKKSSVSGKNIMSVTASAYGVLVYTSDGKLSLHTGAK